MSSDMYDCKICGHRPESSSEVHKCEFIRKADLRKLVEEAKEEYDSVDAVWLAYKIEKLLEDE